MTGENGNIHDHWVEGIGTDTIYDFSKAQGDKIEIAGYHTVAASVSQVDINGDGIGDYSQIKLISNQGVNGGAHNQDLLGIINVLGDAVNDADVEVTQEHYGVADTFLDWLAQKASRSSIRSSRSSRPTPG